MPQLSANLELNFVDSIDKAMAMKRWLGERRPRNMIGFDTETNGLDLYAPHAKLRMVQLGDAEHGWAVPWERWGGVAIECLEAWEGEITAHNLSFDAKAMKVLAGYDMPWDRCHDTLIMANIDSPGSPAGLKALTDKYIDPRASQGDKLLKDAFKNNNWGWHNIPVDFEAYWLYSALDPVLAVELNNHYRHIPENFSKVYDLEMTVRRICTSLEHVGMRIDLDYVQEKHVEIAEKVAECKQWALDNWNLNIASTPQLATFFANTLDAEFSKFTATGKPSVNKEQLDLFQKSEDPLVKQAADFVLMVRKYEKLNSSYFENFIKMNEDGILHPSIRTMGARTGRMSVTDPALQTLPSGDQLIRGAFISRNEGETLVSCDYSQMELRLLAHYSEDPALIEAFRKADEENGDFFNEAGKGIYRDEEFDRHNPKYKKPGKAIKTLFYGLIYGASVSKLSQQAQIPLNEMQEAYDGLVMSFPGIKTFMADTIATGEMRLKEEGVGYARLDSGRILPADPYKMYTLTNYMLQGTGAELTKTALARLDSAGLTPHILMCIHDEIIFSIPDEKLDENMPIIEECMSFVSGEFRVPLPAEPERLGLRWGDGDKYATAS